MAHDTSSALQLILVSGLSGSGKTIVLNVLEDAGFYCVDNLPTPLLQNLVTYLRASGQRRIALGIDTRSGIDLGELPRHVAELRAGGDEVRVLFLDAKSETLMKRFSETRRRHPLSDGRRTVAECIDYERELLADIGSLGQHIDTSDLNANALRAWVRDVIRIDRSRLTLLFESFGFKHGIPLDADLVFDVRCLPNPHYDPQLRPLTGRDGPVIRFLDADADVQRMFDDIRGFVANWLPCFMRDNRSNVTVGIGCTGGQHRSVYLVERFAAHFRDNASTQVLVRHRELPTHVLPAGTLTSV